MEGVIKVADFGLAEDIYTADYFKQSRDSDEPIKLPIKWMALESIHFGRFNEKTDVVSSTNNEPSFSILHTNPYSGPMEYCAGRCSQLVEHLIQALTLEV